MSAKAHHVTNVNQIPFKAPMVGKYPVSLREAQNIAEQVGRDVYWLEPVKTAYYEAAVQK